MKFPYLIISLLILFLTILYLKDRLEHFVSCSREDIENFTGDVSKLKDKILPKPINSHDGVTKFLKKFLGNEQNNFLFREFWKNMDKDDPSGDEPLDLSDTTMYKTIRNIFSGLLMANFTIDTGAWEGDKCEIYNRFLDDIGYDKELMSDPIFGEVEFISKLRNDCAKTDDTIEAFFVPQSPSPDFGHETSPPTDDINNEENPAEKLVITSYPDFINHIYRICLGFYELMHNYTDHDVSHTHKDNKAVNIAKTHLKKIHNHIHKKPPPTKKHPTEHTHNHKKPPPTKKHPKKHAHTHKDHTKHTNTHKKQGKTPQSKCKDKIDENKFILKSKLLPYPDMTQFVRKNELKKYEIDKTKYIHKSNIPSPSRIPDVSKYILKTEMKPFKSVNKWNNHSNIGSRPLDMSLDYSLYPKPVTSCHTDSSCMNSDLNWNHSQVHDHKHNNVNKNIPKKKKGKNENDFNEKRLGRCSLFGESLNNTNIFGEY